MNQIINVLSKVKGGIPGSLLTLMYSQIKTRNSANESYSDIKIVLDILLMNGSSFTSPEVQGLVELLKKLPARGACARNFEKLYLKDEYGLRKLPTDPRRIPKGHWH